MKIGILELIKSKKEHYVKTISTVAIINLILAIIALIKDMSFASYLGTSSRADALILAYFITDMLGNNLFANVVGISSIPTFSKLYVKNNKEGLYAGLINVNIFTILVSLLLIILLYIFKAPIISILGSGTTNETKMLSISLLSILLPTMLLYPLVTAGASALQIIGRFNISSLPPVVFNAIFLIGIIVALVFNVNQDTGVYVVTASILIGVVLMWILVYSFIPKFNISLASLRSSLKYREQTTKILKTLLPLFCIILLSQAVLYVERYLASFFGDGSVAALTYAYRLSQFPIWVFVGAVGTVTFPLMAIAKEKGDMIEVKKIIQKALGLILIVTVPMVIILNILRDPIITLLFLRGAFDYNSLSMTSVILMGYSIAILGQSITAIALKVFLSMGDIRPLLKAFLISVTVNIVVDLYLVKIIGLSGIGFGAAIGGILNAVLLIYFMKQKFGFDYKNITKKFVKILYANISVIIITIIFNACWNNIFINMIFLYKFIIMAFAMLIIAIIYYFSLKALRVV